MTKLSDTQLMVLSKAAAREDRLAVAPAKLSKAALAKVGTSLVARKLMREMRAKSGMPVWREDEDGRGVSLMITRAGRKALGVEDDGTASKESDAAPKMQKRGGGESETGAAQLEMITSATSAPREGSKQALVISMLAAKTGTTIDALVNATGWLPHTTRAALTGLRKRGFMIERSRANGEASVYRISGATTAA